MDSAYRLRPSFRQYFVSICSCFIRHISIGLLFPRRGDLLTIILGLEGGYPLLGGERPVCGK